MSKPFILVPGQLSLQDIRQLLKSKQTIELDPSCIAKMDAAKSTIQDILNAGKIVYGVNTGFGILANQIISADHLIELQRNLVLSHACGTGELLPDEIVALCFLLKINNLAQGYSGVSLALVQALCQLYNAQVYPCIPSRGSVGASGDLAPLAHLTMPLIGEGEVRFQGKIISALDGLAIAGLAPFTLGPKEGLAFLNGLQVSTAIAIHALLICEDLFETAVIAGSLTVDAASASDVPFDPRIQAVRGHQAQISVAEKYRMLLQDSPIRQSHTTGHRVQDPYCLRCQPQIMGAVAHQIEFVKQTFEIEANAVSDNPLIFTETKDVLSGGNFHGEIIAMAADNLSLAIAEMGANAERRIALLVDTRFSGLPAFLVKEGGLNSGFMIAHVTAAACASDNKALAHPHSVDSLPTSANQEDIVSMATGASLRLLAMLDNTATILAIELLAACQGLEFHAPLTTSKPLHAIYQLLRQWVKPYDQDRFFAPDIAVIKHMVLAGQFATIGTHA